MISKLKRTPGIYLVGFMASGKSVVGKKLAEKIGWNFADIDTDIESEQKTTINEIFDTRGEAEFRRLEYEAIRGRVHLIQSGHATVVALGGGAYGQPRNRDLIEHNGVSIWLDCPLPLIRRRLEGSQCRPLARDPAKFEVLFYARRESYSRADYCIEVTSDDTGLTVEAVLALPIF